MQENKIGCFSDVQSVILFWVRNCQPRQ